MTAVMQTNPALAVADDEDDVALAAFLAPNWGRFDQDKLAFDIMSYRETPSDHYADYNMKQRKAGNGDIQVQKSSSTPVLRSRDRQSMPPLYQPPKQPIPPRREESPSNRQSMQRRDESPKSRSPSGKPRRESPPSRSSENARDSSPGSSRRPSPQNARPPQAYQSPSDHKHHHSLPKRSPTPIPLLTQSSAQFTVKDRRPSINSVKSSSPSIRSEMSMNTKLSLSKRLRRVFSMSSLSLKNNSSSTSLASQVSVAESDIIPKASRSSSAHSITGQQPTATESQPSVKPTTSVSTPPKSSSRRRSLVTLSNIFSRSSDKQKAEQVEPTVQAVIVPAQTGANQRHSAADLRKMINEPTTASHRASAKPERPKLDTSLESIQPSAKPSLKQTRRTSSSRSPDSPSSISSSSRSPVTPPPHRQGSGAKVHSSYASAVTSNARQRQSSLNSNSSARPDYFTAVDLEHSEMLVPPPSAGLHSLPLHGSPRMKPASQSNTSLSEPTTIREMPPPATTRTRRLGFSPSITVHETFSANEYDRRCDPNVTCCKLTPEFAMRIKQELNEYKLTGMEVHIESRQYTHFFL
ncbi:hypothetical protein VKS41_007868 [Umbelopsis sp. WA50703]